MLLSYLSCYHTLILLNLTMLVIPFIVVTNTNNISLTIVTVYNIYNIYINIYNLYIFLRKKQSTFQYCLSQFLCYIYAYIYIYIYGTIMRAQESHRDPKSQQIRARITQSSNTNRSG